MKAIIISILLFFTTYSQNIWYVDRDATGANTGRSWTDAWTSFDSTAGYSGMTTTGINWSIIEDGDSIYVSGGTDSTRYFSKDANGILYIGANGSLVGQDYIPADKVFNETVTVARSWETGHNGEVWLTTYSTTEGQLYIMRIQEISNVKFVGFYVGARGTSHAEGGNIFPDANDITLDGWHFKGTGYGGAIGTGSDRTKYLNCTFEQVYNSNPDDQDMLGFQNGYVGSFTIDNSKIIYRNDNVGTTSHRDMLQAAIGSLANTDSTATAIISNCLFIDTEPLGTGWNGGIYFQNAYIKANVYFYNNIIVSRKTQTDFTPLWMGYENTGPPEALAYSSSLFVLNNTIIMKGSGSSPFAQFYRWDTLVVKNNLFIMDTSTTDPLMGISLYPPDSQKVYADYNGYFELGGVSGWFSDGAGYGSYTFAQWQAAGYDVNSITGNSNTVTFSDKYSEEITGYYTTAGRDLGTDLSVDFPFLATDILGNPRTGDWDMGALEYVETPPSGINVKSKIFLQGPFNSNLMTTTLNQSALLPSSQPYNSSPWNYTGNESFNPGSNSTIVDWVLVELRSASNPAQVVSRRAALLKNNGLLLETNGSEGIFFSNVEPGSYYIAIYHRNHLAIMSSTPVPLSSNSALYDFTTAMNKAYGQNPMVELGAEKYGMYATDGNADGVVNTADRDDVWLNQNGNMGYLEGDFNMNTGVTVHDVNQLWNMNNGAMTQVP